MLRTGSHFLAKKPIALVLAFVGLLPLAVHAQQPAVKEYYQDFRNKKPLSADFRLGGFAPDIETKHENEGLRITLPAERQQHWVSEVATNFPLIGDFEFTATYELLSAKRPFKGYGVGANLTLADTNERKKFAKISRVFRPGEGSVYFGEYWAPYQSKVKRTDVMSGQLRLVRIGESLRFLVSEGPGQEFEEVWRLNSFGDEDMDHVGFSISDSGEPNNPVDARLIDLRVRMGKIQPDLARSPAPLPIPEVKDDVPAPTPAREGSNTWLIVTLLIVVSALALIGAGVIVVIVMRRRQAPPPTEEPLEADEEVIEPAAPIAVICPNCKKKLKVKAAHAGKKLKCPGCGKTVAVPGGEIKKA